MRVVSRQGIRWMDIPTEYKFDRDGGRDPEFNSLKKLPEFQALVARASTEAAGNKWKFLALLAEYGGKKKDA